MSITHAEIRAASMGAAAALALAGASASGAGFFVAGWPVADPSHTAVSSTTSIFAGPARDTSSPCALDARGRTIGLSGTSAFRSDKYCGFVLIVR